MKTSIKSKLFLLSYAIVLAFIVGLIILNNSFLNQYYVHNRQNSLIQAFDELKSYDVNSSGLSDEVLNIEKEHNISIQVLKQITLINPDTSWDEFNNMPNLYQRLYGDNYSIPPQILSRIIFEFNRDDLTSENASFDKKIDKFGDDYKAYIVSIQSNIQDFDKNVDSLGLCVLTQDSQGSNIYYILTVTLSSIEDSVQIFNSFTIIVGFVFMILSGLVLYFISYRLTNPILEMNKIAQEIAGLNFSNRVNIKSDDEVGTLGQSINKMSSQLEEFINELQLTNDKLGKEILYKTEVDNMRKEFIASASHELKTPLSLIMGYAEALKLPNLDAATKEEYLSIIQDESEKMNRLVMDLLKLSQLENRSVDYEIKEVDIEKLIDDTIKLFTIIFTEKAIELETDIKPAKINTDYDQIQTVLTNFINNAINHVDDKKTIRINTAEIADGTIRISVFNTGTNISMDEMKNIWESFYKVDKARTREYGGQGLGLAICKNILESLNYNYGVKNVEDGVEFYFDISIDKNRA